MNIKDSLARKGDLVAMVVYSWEVYRSWFGGSVEDFKDFLVARQEYLEEIMASSPARVVQVPFSETCFEEWLAGRGWLADRSRRGNALALHTRWALEVAGNEALLARLRQEEPLHPAPPVEERIECEVSYVMLPLVFSRKEEFRVATGPLPRGLLLATVAVLHKLLPGCPPLDHVSRMRCRGLAVALGDRLIDGSATEQLAVDLKRRVTRAISSGAGFARDGLLSLPRQSYGPLVLAARASGYPLLFPLFLPVVLAGAHSEVGFAARYLEHSEGPVALLNQVGETVRNLGLKIAGNDLIWVLSSHLAEGTGDVVREECADLVGDIAGDEPKKSRPVSYLRLIK